MIRKRITAYLKKNRITQAYLCRETGITTQRMSSILHGGRKMSVDEYEKICGALGLPCHYFFKVYEEDTET